MGDTQLEDGVSFFSTVTSNDTEHGYAAFKCMGNMNTHGKPGVAERRSAQ